MVNGSICLHADPTTRATAEAQGDGYPVLHVRTDGTDLTLFGPLHRNDSAAQLAFAQSLVDAAAVFLAVTQEYVAALTPATDAA